MSVLDIAAIGFLFLVVLIAVGLIGLVAAYRHQGRAPLTTKPASRLPHLAETESKIARIEG